VIGRSTGGLIALAVALEYPDAVRALVLLEPALFTAHPEADRWARALRRAVLDAPPGRAAQVTIGAALGDRAWEAIPGELREIFTAGDAAVLAETRGRGMDLSDVPLVVGPERLATLTVPTLLVSGEDSIAACRLVNEQLTEAIPGAGSVVVPGGHLINPAHPVVMDFITGVLHNSSR
jgi:pimeloyl-ACP methyl ester carboxylesterase